MNPSSVIGGTVFLITISTGFVVTKLLVESKRKLSVAGRLGTTCVCFSCFFSILAAVVILWRTRQEIIYKDSTDPTFFPPLGVPVAIGEKSLKVVLIELYSYPTGIWLVKLAFMGMYFDISRHLSKKLRMIFHLSTGYIVFSYLVVIISYSVWCRPFSLNWYVGLQFCSPIQSLENLALYTTFNVTSDLLVMTMPLLILRTLQIRRREKWAIAFLLFLGAITILTSISRSLVLRTMRVLSTSVAHYCEILSLAELCAALIAVSLPSFRACLYWKRDGARTKDIGKGSGKEYSYGSGKGVSEIIA